MKYIFYYKNPLLFTVLGLLIGAWLGWQEAHNVSKALEVFFICLVLAVLEISLSFDNAIVNARILQHMSLVWQRRFLTYGIIFAVFFMRLVFPIIIVSFTTHLNPIDALRLAIFDKDQYAQIMENAHIPISAFGGSFLLMVGLNYFFDPEKEEHWLKPLEQRAYKIAEFPAVALFIALLVILLFTHFIQPSHKLSFLSSALYGLILFLAIEGVSKLLEIREENLKTIQKSGVLAFLYLEVLDASFSLDGVIGAFALSKNLFIIAIGLGIGAFYVRAMTIMLVEKSVLMRYRYLEHGAFYAILALALMMFFNILIHIPEYITGLIGVLFILMAFISSLKAKE